MLARLAVPGTPSARPVPAWASNACFHHDFAHHSEAKHIHLLRLNFPIQCIFLSSNLESHPQRTPEQSSHKIPQSSTSLDPCALFSHTFQTPLSLVKSTQSVGAPLTRELGDKTSSSKKRKLNKSERAGESSSLRQAQHIGATHAVADHKPPHRRQLRSARSGSPAFLPSSPRHLPLHLQEEVHDSTLHKGDRYDISSSAASSPSGAYAGLSLENRSGGDPGEVEDRDLEKIRAADLSDGVLAPAISLKSGKYQLRSREDGPRTTKRARARESNQFIAMGADEQMDIDSVSPPTSTKETSSSSDAAPEDQVMQSIESANGSSSTEESENSTATSLPGSDDAPSEIDNQCTQILNIMKEHNWEDGQVAYLISKEWLWRPLSRCSFVSTLAGTLGKPPKNASIGEIGDIDNSNIVLQGDNPIYEGLENEHGLPFVPIRDDMVEKHDFEFMPEKAWNLIECWYELAAGSFAITRTAKVSPEDKDSFAPVPIIELHPPVFLLRKLSADGSGDESSRAPRVLSSIHQSFQDFLLNAKKLLGIDAETEVRVWHIDESQKDTNSSLGTPLASRNVSPAPKVKVDLDFNKTLSIDVNEFLSFSTPLQRDLLVSKDPTVGNQGSDSSSVSAKGLSKSGIYILEERIGGPAGGEWPSDAASQGSVKGSSQSQQNDRLSALKSGPNKSDSHIGGGVMTRGRAQKNARTVGKCGLVNLGNTCYMNSALQCIRSVEELTKYFISDAFTEELNFDNPLAYNGEVARNYGILIHQIYKKDFSGPYAPRQFKNTIGRCNNSFLGYGQQDSQEFLGFLLDALNEDLCRIKKKPYFSHPDSTEEHVKSTQALKALADQVWEGHVSRNSSVVTDLFAGLYKSTLVCPVCGKISITFDPFNTLTLQLPQPPFRKEILVWPLNKPWVKMTVELEKHSTIRTLKEFVAKRLNIDADRLQVSETYSEKFYRHYTDAEDATDAIVPNDIVVVYELEAPSTNVPEYANPGMADLSKIKGEALDQMLVPVVFLKPGNRLQSPEPFGFPTFILLTQEESRDYDIIFRKLLQKIDQSTTINVFQGLDHPDNRVSGNDNEMTSTADDSDSSESTKVKTSSIEGEDGFVNVSKDSGVRRPPTPPESVQSNPLHTAILDQSVPIPRELTESFEICHFKGDGEALAVKYHAFANSNTLLKAKITGVIEDFTSDEDSSSIPGAFGPVADPLSDEASQDSPNAYSKALEDRESNPSEDDEKLPPRAASNKKPPRNTDESYPISVDPLVGPGEGLIIQMSTKIWRNLYDGDAGLDDDCGQGKWVNAEEFHDQELVDRQQVRLKMSKNGILLEDCLDEFKREEVLSEQDQWYCNQCKLHRRATKQLELWKAPDILVVHLKRFSAAIRAFRDKVETLVQFPVTDLDLTKRILGKEDGKEYIYDLFAVDNHYGGLGGGHYTAYAQNFVNGVWYDYNDTSVSQVKNVESVVTSAAYLLFYRRRSMTPLGGEKLARIVERADRSPPHSPSPTNNSCATSPSAPAGEGQRLGDSSHPGSSIVSHGSGAAARSTGDGLTGLTGATVLNVAPALTMTASENDADELPRYSLLDEAEDVIDPSGQAQPLTSLTSGGSWNWDAVRGEDLNDQGGEAATASTAKRRSSSVASAHAGSQMSDPDDRMKDFDDEDLPDFDVNPNNRSSLEMEDAIPELDNDVDDAIDMSEDVRIARSERGEMDDPPVVEISVEKDEGLSG